MRLLFEKGVDPDFKNEYNRTPLSWVAEDGHDAVIKLLLEKGVDPDFKNKYCQTPLSWVAEDGHETVINLLLEKRSIRILNFIIIGYCF